jgi:hypothetical protein
LKKPYIGREPGALRRGHATEYKKTLRKPTEQDWQKLVQAAMEGIIDGKENILISFSHLVILPLDFPAGWIMWKHERNDIRKINCNKLLNWLHKEGHTEITPLMLNYEKGRFSKEFSELFNKLEGSFDEGI